MVGLDGGIMKITVFLGSMFGSRPVYKAAVTKLGRWIGKEGHWLVYGGSMTGLMGTLAEAVLSAGGKVTGVEPQMFVEQDLQSDEITELIVVPDIPSRSAGNGRCLYCFSGRCRNTGRDFGSNFPCKDGITVRCLYPL